MFAHLDVFGLDAMDFRFSDAEILVAMNAADAVVVKSSSDPEAISRLANE